MTRGGRPARPHNFAAAEPVSCSATAAPLVVIVGPTASGKSALAESLAQRLDAEIVSADAFQVYRGLDIGTAKPSPDQRTRFAYHCLDLLEPDERCTAGRFAREARAALERIRSRGRLPILVGGSGFYVHAAIHGLKPLPNSDPEWRAALSAVRERRGTEFVFRMLHRLDRDRAEAIGNTDGQRLLRALEIVLRSGRPVSQAAHSQVGDVLEPLTDPVMWFGIERDRADQRARIATRVAAMLAAGWRDEVSELLARGISRSAHGLQAIGYRELAAVAADEMGLAEAVDRIARATHRYAKRQMTWFRRCRRVDWMRPDRIDEAVAVQSMSEYVLERITQAGSC